jgi:phospholipid-binding lipoprotein MlaA
MVGSMSSLLSRTVAKAAAVAVLIAGLSGCATPPPDSDAEARADWERINDPLEPMNRAIFDFNMVVDRVFFKPLAQGYREVVPQYGRDRIHDFINNWRAPLILANDILQGNADRAVQTFMRFTFNTGFGVLGAFDLAGPGGIPFHEEDLGQTFAVWGVGEGPYLVLPIFGPSNPRDSVGMAGEWVGDPVGYRLSQIDLTWVDLTRSFVGGIDKREHNLDGLNEVERTALDLYSTIRSLWRQRREAEIKNSPDVNRIPAPGFTSAPSHGSELSQETR